MSTRAQLNIASILLAVILLCLAGSLKAQSFPLGQHVISAGLGIGGTFGSYAYTSQTPAIGLSYEHAMWETGGPGVIGIGAYLGFKSYTYNGREWYGKYDHRYNYAIFGARAAYHYDFTGDGKLDTYGGLFLGFRSLSFKADYATGYQHYAPAYKSLSFGASLYVGARYYFTPTAGAFAEIGYGISYLTLGGQIRF